MSAESLIETNPIDLREFAGQAEGEQQLFRDYQVVVTGAIPQKGSSIGSTIAATFANGGATVYAGTRNIERLIEFRDSHERLLEQSNEDIQPFLVDLTTVTRDGEIINHSMHSSIGILSEQLRMDGRPVVLVHNAAAGGQKAIKTLVVGMMWLQREGELSEEERERKHQKLQQKIAKAADQDRPAAELVNCTGAIALTENLLDRMPEGSKVVSISSLPSTLYDAIPPLGFYDVVAGPKHAFEQWMTSNAPQFQARGIDSIIVSGNAIVGTDVGDFLTQTLPQLFEEENVRFPLEPDELPTVVDVAHAVAYATRHPDKIGRDKHGVGRLYLFNKNTAQHELTPEQIDLIGSIPRLHPVLSVA